MRDFIQRNLDAVDRLGEILFALIMALGFTGAVRLGLEEATHEELFLGIFGCNLAWAIVDGALYVVGAVFERGRRRHLVRLVAAAPTEEVALGCIAGEIDEHLEALATDEERTQLYRWTLGILRRNKIEGSTLAAEDLKGGLAVAIVVLMATIPVVVPFLVVTDIEHAVRLSNSIAVGMLALLGARWARLVGSSPWALAAGLSLFGVLLVLVTIALGG